MDRFWSRIISLLFQKEQPKRVVAIGAPMGEFAIQLLHFCHNKEGELIIIDPFNVFQEDERINGYRPHYQVIREESLEALPNIGSIDAVLIDGDHNWYTVYHELKQIEMIAEQTGKFPLVFLHDTEWPYGRRDLYHNPENISPEFRQPYERKGIVYGQSQLADQGGFCEGAYHAINENGEKNGVLTAIEDFLGETNIHLSFFHLTSNNGLGIITEANRDTDTYIEMITKHSGM
ncbi:family 2 glycosyl transferase [Brevibacillus choshinensis]|uniref:Family 2 glycosyl transferase n=1 Tax=Brevibacillus choshinensis TaxID=54911 RepID=A0ABR5NB02_BRECH|nr:class I SAM-dependent methyltransferase [Brevibacillus choshinensis]KQL48725.1 family 2 glycosyl transferase [Brevibacillus choshinensis]